MFFYLKRSNTLNGCQYVCVVLDLPFNGHSQDTDHTFNYSFSGNRKFRWILFKVISDVSYFILFDSKTATP